MRSDIGEGILIELQNSELSVCMKRLRPTFVLQIYRAIDAYHLFVCLICRILHSRESGNLSDVSSHRVKAVRLRLFKP